MKWANHKLVTTVVVFAGTGNFLYAAYSFFGSVLPDRLEGKPPKESKAYWKWRLFYLHEVGVLKDLFWEIAQIPIFVCVGALLHIIEDGICGKVPLIWRKRKIGIKLFRVGSSWEYFISYTICVAALYYRFML